ESGTGRSQAARRTIGSGPRRPRPRSETRLHTQRSGTRLREPVSEHHGALQYLARNRELPVLPRRSAHSRTRLPHLPEAKRDHEPRSRTAYRQAMRTQEAPKDNAARHGAQDEIAARFHEVASCVLLWLYRLQECALWKNRS